MIRIAARLFVRHRDSDDVDVSKAGIRIPAVQRQVRSLGLEASVPGDKRVRGGIRVAARVGSRVAGSEPHRVVPATTARPLVEIEPRMQ